MPQSFPVGFDLTAAHEPYFGAHESNQTTRDAKDNHQHAQNSNGGTRMVQIAHSIKAIHRTGTTVPIEDLSN